MTRRENIHTEPVPAMSPKGLLLPYQRRWVDDPARFKLGVWSRQTGKSFSTAGEAVEDCLRDPGTKWVCLSAGERQALQWLGQAKEWAEAYRLAVEGYAEDRGFAEALLKSAEIRFGNGSTILAVPANPATARGYSANVILDEFAYHEDPDAIWAAMFPSITNPLAGTFVGRLRARLKGQESTQRRIMRVRVVSTFNGRGNKFFELYDKAQAGGSDWSVHKVTLEDAVVDGLPVDMAELRAGLDDPDIWAQEYECEPIDTSSVLLPYELIAQAESADASEVWGADAPARKGRQTYCGIDFGRQQDPTVCWTLERQGDVLWTREVLVLKGQDVPTQQAILSERVKACLRACYDYTGPGVGLGDCLVRDAGIGEYKAEAHRFGKLELCTFSVGFKRDVFPKLRRAFEPPVRVRVPISRAIREDLHAMQQKVNNGQYDYWAPRTREGHSDRCTALALAVRAAGEGRGRPGVA